MHFFLFIAVISVLKCTISAVAVMRRCETDYKIICVVITLVVHKKSVKACISVITISGNI